MSTETDNGCWSYKGKVFENLKLYILDRGNEEENSNQTTYIMTVLCWLLRFRPFYFQLEWLEISWPVLITFKLNDVIGLIILISFI